MSSLYDLTEFARLRDRHRLEGFEARLPGLKATERRYRSYLERVEAGIRQMRKDNASTHDINEMRNKKTAIWWALSPVIGEIGIIEHELPGLRAAVTGRNET